MYIYRYKEQEWLSNTPIDVFSTYEVIEDDVDRSGEHISYFLYNADKKKSKVVVPIDDFFSETLDHESIDRFLGERKSKQNTAQVAINLNWLGEVTAENLYNFINERKMNTNRHRVHVMGMGDVGSTLAMGLKLLGGDVISEIGVWDIDSNRKKRWEIELNQIIVNPNISVKAIDDEALFSADVFVFCASKYVPAVGEKISDVRMMQLEMNAELVKIYTKKAAEASFKGLFCIVSDPVDMLCKVAFETSMVLCNGAILPEQIRGYGLGVMYARARYYAHGSFENGRVYGPHGKELVVADDVLNYDHDMSMQITEKTVTANLVVRDLGFKPYVAPAISSGAYSIVETLKGEWHDSAVFLGGHYFGCRNKLTPWGTEIEQLLLDKKLFDRIKNAYERLAIIWDAFNF